jgi:polar amino acid transport system permease protein
MTCGETFEAYALRAIGIGERLLPQTDFTLCQQFVLIGSGMVWNLYFAVLALSFGFFLAAAVAVARTSHNPLIRKPAEWFVFLFRGNSSDRFACLEPVFRRSGSSFWPRPWRLRAPRTTR